MPENEALLATVIENPDDDAPRLVYADWLEENGDPDRAEFIRVQIQLARLPGDDPQRKRLKKREGQLLKRYARKWAEPLKELISEWVYERGFIERAKMDLECHYGGRSRETIVRALQLAPIRHIRDTNQFCHLDAVVEVLPHFERFTGLEFWGLYSVKEKQMRNVLTSPHLRNLRTLILYHDRNGAMLRDHVVVEAVQSPFRSNLTELAVNVDGSWQGPSNRVIQAIVRSPHLARLQRLNLSCTRMDLKTARLFVASPYLTNLTELDLGGCECTEPVWRTLLESPNLGQLRWLRLNDARVMDAEGKWRGHPLSYPDLQAILDSRFRPKVIDTQSEFVDDCNDIFNDHPCARLWHGHKWEE